MPLGYNTNADTSGGGDYPPLKPGEYLFKVDSAEETTFSSGNRGLKVKLLVDNGERDVPCYVNLVYTDNMMWKLSHFLECLGFDFKEPPDAWQLVGKTGSADFTVEPILDKETKKPTGKTKFNAKDFIVEEALPKVTRGGAKRDPNEGIDEAPF